MRRLSRSRARGTAAPGLRAMRPGLLACVLLVSSSCARGDAEVSTDIPRAVAEPLRQLVSAAMDTGHAAGLERMLAGPGLDLDGEANQAMLAYAKAVGALLDAQGVEMQKRTELITSLATCYATSYAAAAKGMPLSDWRAKSFDAFVVTAYNLTR